MQERYGRDVCNDMRVSKVSFFGWTINFSKACIRRIPASDFKNEYIQMGVVAVHLYMQN